MLNFGHFGLYCTCSTIYQMYSLVYQHLRKLLCHTVSAANSEVLWRSHWGRVVLATISSLGLYYLTSQLREYGRILEQVVIWNNTNKNMKEECTVMILSFRTDMPGQTVQTQIRLLLIFLGVRIFWKLTVVTALKTRTVTSFMVFSPFPWCFEEDYQIQPSSSRTFCKSV